ncbi:hypothetical protein HYU16_05245 [Candidatus Woesearchaeota archaeon]|nr:hypothetical protein [Candidatus Woesearchaeota archaeon]
MVKIDLHLQKSLTSYKNKSPSVKTLIHWYDLYERHSIKIENNFLLLLLRRAIYKAGNISNLGKELHISRKVLSTLLHGRYNPKIITLRKVAEYVNYPLNKIDKKVIELRNLKPNLPFNLNTKEGAEIRAAFLSDGHNDKNPAGKPQYCALEKELHVRLIELCGIVFGAFKAKTIFNNRSYITRFPAVLGSALKLSGVPRGSKQIANCYVPKDIFLGSKQIQTAYLRRCFDDEGDVCFDSHGKRAVRLARSVDITTSCNWNNLPSEKWIRYNLPDTIRNNLLFGEWLLLLRLKIDARFYPEGIYLSKNKQITAKWRIQIGQQDNVRRFSNLIGFNLRNKKEKLSKMINSYKFRKLPNGEGRKQALFFIRKVYNEKGYFQFNDLGKELVAGGRSHDLAGMYLKEFIERGLISKVKRGIYIFKQK